MTVLDASLANEQPAEVVDENLFLHGKVLLSRTHPSANMERDLVPLEEGKSIPTGPHLKLEGAEADDDDKEAHAFAGQKRRRPGLFRYPSDLSGPDFNSCSDANSTLEEEGERTPEPVETTKKTIDGMNFSEIMSAAAAAMASTGEREKQHEGEDEDEDDENDEDDEDDDDHEDEDDDEEDDDHEDEEDDEDETWKPRLESRTASKRRNGWNVDTAPLEDRLGLPPRHDERLNGKKSAAPNRTFGGEAETLTRDRLQSLFEDSSSDTSKLIVFEEDDSGSDFSFMRNGGSPRKRGFSDSARSNSRSTISSAGRKSKSGRARTLALRKGGSARLPSTHQQKRPPPTIHEEVGAFSSSPPISAPVQKAAVTGGSATAMAAASGARRASMSLTLSTFFQAKPKEADDALPNPKSRREGGLTSQRSMSRLHDPVMVSERQKMPVTSAARRDYLMEIANDMDGWLDDENDEDARMIRKYSQHDKNTTADEKHAHSARTHQHRQDRQESMVLNNHNIVKETKSAMDMEAAISDDNVHRTESTYEDDEDDDDEDDDEDDYLVAISGRHDDAVPAVEETNDADVNTPVRMVRGLERFSEDVSTLSSRAGSAFLSDAGSLGAKALSLLASYLESTGHSPEDAVAVASSFATLKTDVEATNYLRPPHPQRKDAPPESAPQPEPKGDIWSQLEEQLNQLPSAPKRAVSERSKYSFQTMFSLDELWKKPTSSPRRAVSSQNRFGGNRRTSPDELWKNPTAAPKRNVSGQSRFSAHSRSSGRSRTSGESRWDFKSTCVDDNNDDDDHNDEGDSSVLLETVPMSCAPGLDRAPSSSSFDWEVDSPRVKDDFLRRLRQKEDFMYANRRPSFRRNFGRSRRASLGAIETEKEESASKHYRRLSDDTNTRSRDFTDSGRSDPAPGNRLHWRASEPGAVHLNTRPFGQTPVWSSSLRGDGPEPGTDDAEEPEDNVNVFPSDQPVEATVVADDSEMGSGKRGTSSELVMVYAERMPPAIKLVVNDPTFRRVCPLIIAISSVVISAIVAIVATGQPKITAAEVNPLRLMEVTMTPTSAPTASNAPTVNIGPLRDIISAYSDVNTLSAVGTPQNSALAWLAQKDQLSVLTNEPALVQRYAMATIFFATSEGNGWLFDDDWLHPWTHECTWGRIVDCVTVDGFRFVRSLAIDANTLQGTIPAEIGLLTRLEHFSISENSVRGSIPDEICKLTSLNKLDLSSNHIWGTLPECIPDARGLVQLDVSQNRINGGLPESYSNLVALEELDLSQTDLTGTIPEGVCDLVWQGSLTLLEVDTSEVECGCCERQEG